MKKYSLVIWSFEPQKIDMFEHIFMNGVLSKLIFPAKIYVGEKKSQGISLLSPREFSTSLISKEDYSSESGRIPLYLYPDTGLEFYAAALPSPYVSPCVIAIKFTEKHIQESVCTLDDIKMLFSESIPGFKADQAALYDTYLEKIPEPNGGYSFKRPKSYKRPAGGTYRLELDWLTYFGSDYLNLLGRDRFDKLLTCYEKRDVGDGILVVLQDEPFDNTNPEHLARKKQAEAELGFDKLLGAK